MELKRSFPSARAFREFLLSRPDPGGSRVHDGIADGLDYLLSDPVIASGKTRSALLVLSDMENNVGDPQESEARLLRSLSAYGHAGGVVGLYWVNQTLVLRWRQHLSDCRIRNFVVESEIRDNPPLPRRPCLRFSVHAWAVFRAEWQRRCQTN